MAAMVPFVVHAGGEVARSWALKCPPLMRWVATQGWAVWPTRTDPPWHERPVTRG